MTAVPKFSAYIEGVKKANNTPRAEHAKAQIRLNVLEGLAGKGDVFDAYAGDGHMHAAVWSKARSYVGCDTIFVNDGRTAFVADNRRVLRCLDLTRFNIFDFDAYGSPWEQVYILAMRRPLAAGETIGLIITDGQAMKLKMGGMSRALSMLSGIKNQSGLGRRQEEIMDRALISVAALMHATIAHRWQAIGKTGSRMMYIGLLLRSDQ